MSEKDGFLKEQFGNLMKAISGLTSSVKDLRESQVSKGGVTMADPKAEEQKMRDEAKAAKVKALDEAKAKAEAKKKEADDAQKEADAAKKAVDEDDACATVVVDKPIETRDGVKVPDMAEAGKSGTTKIDPGIDPGPTPPAFVSGQEESNKKPGVFQEQRASEEAAALAAKASEDAIAAKKKEIDDFMHKKPNPDGVSYASGLSEGAKALASKYSFAELLEVVSSLSLENASLKEKDKKAEATLRAEARFKELSDLGLASTIAEKADKQKSRLSEMTEEAFASYKDELSEVIPSKSPVEKAKEAVGSLSSEVSLEPSDLTKEYSKLA